MLETHGRTELEHRPERRRLMFHHFAPAGAPFAPWRTRRARGRLIFPLFEEGHESILRYLVAAVEHDRVVRLTNPFEVRLAYELPTGGQVGVELR